MSGVIKRRDLANAPDHPLLADAIEFLNERIEQVYAANPENESDVQVDFEDVSWRIGLEGKPLPGDLVAQIVKAYEVSDLVSCKKGWNHHSKPRFEFPRRRA